MHDYRLWGYCIEMTWLLIHMMYQYARSILRLLHDVCTICTIFKLPACYNTLPNRDCEHGVLYYRNYHSRICFLTSLVRYSFSFFAFLLTLHLGFFAINGIIIESWLWLFLTANLNGITDLLTASSNLQLDFSHQLGPTHLSVQIVKFLQLPNPY